MWPTAAHNNNKYKLDGLRVVMIKKKSVLSMSLTLNENITEKAKTIENINNEHLRMTDNDAITPLADRTIDPLTEFNW